MRILCGQTCFRERQHTRGWHFWGSQLPRRSCRAKRICSVSFPSSPWDSTIFWTYIRPSWLALQEHQNGTNFNVSMKFRKMCSSIQIPLKQDIDVVARKLTTNYTLTENTNYIFITIGHASSWSRNSSIDLQNGSGLQRKVGYQETTAFGHRYI